MCPVPLHLERVSLDHPDVVRVISSTSLCLLPWTNVHKEVAQKGLKPSRASLIRSSANEILQEVRRGMAVEDPAESEESSQMEREQLERLGT